MTIKNKIAIVILNWNGEKFLKQFLPSVTKYSTLQGVELYVADNGSTDNSIVFLKKNYPQIKLILLDKNYGFAGGYNKSLAQIKADYFVLLNSDVEVTPNWVAPIIDFMNKNKDVAAVMPKILSLKEKEKFEYAGAGGGFIDKYGYPFCRGRIIDEIEKDNGQYDDTKEIFWATGACFFVRANIFSEIGGFDEDFFAHMEEIDLCWRIKNQNHKIYYISDSIVYHLGGGTLPNNNSKKLFYNFRNNLLLLYKNLSADKVFFTIFIRLILDGLSATLYLLTFKFSFFFVVIKSHFAFYKLISKFRKKRKKYHLNNKKTHKEIYNKSIIYNFFVKKKKKFTDLEF